MSAVGISNDGNFYISANSGTPQKVATTATSSYFANLTQEDGYDVGQFVVGETTTNPQNLHVYSSYASSSNWTPGARTSIPSKGCKAEITSTSTFVPACAGLNDVAASLCHSE